MNSRQHLCLAAAVTALCLTTATIGRAFAQDLGDIDVDALVAIPLEADDAYQPRTPRTPESLTPVPTTQPVAPQSTEPAVEAPPAFDTLTGDWGGRRAALTEKGLSLDLTLVVDVAKNFHGGLDTESTAGQYLLNLNLTFDTKPLLGIDGGTVFVGLQSHGGADPSSLLVGDFQGASNIAADARDQISEAWYAQTLLDKHLTLKAGKIDVTGDLAMAEIAGAFVNGAMGFPVSAGPLPTYPDPAFGLMAIAFPTEKLYVAGGLFDGAGQEGVFTGENGPHTFFGEPADLFLIGEAGYAWDAPGDRPGRVRGGVLYYTGEFAAWDGGSQSSAAGYYVMLEQRLWRENPTAGGAEADPQGICACLEFDWADANVFELSRHGSAIATWTGALPGRDADVIGAGVSWAEFTDRAASDFTEDAETAFEAFYTFEVRPGLTIQPDVQYILNPGGGDLTDALVATVRISAAF